MNHKDQNPSNNKVDNLEWCTYSYNNTYNDAIAKRVNNTDYEKSAEKRILNLQNKVFGRLIVVERFKNPIKTKGVQWKCLCECGKTTVVMSDKLVSGHTKSCGCLKRDTLIKNNKLYKTKEYLKSASV